MEVILTILGFTLTIIFYTPRAIENLQNRKRQKDSTLVEGKKSLKKNRKTSPDPLDYIYDSGPDLDAWTQKFYESFDPGLPQEYLVFDTNGFNGLDLIVTSRPNKQCHLIVAVSPSVELWTSWHDTVYRNGFFWQSATFANGVITRDLLHYTLDKNSNLYLTCMNEIRGTKTLADQRRMYASIPGTKTYTFTGGQTYDQQIRATDHARSLAEWTDTVT